MRSPTRHLLADVALFIACSFPWQCFRPQTDGLSVQLSGFLVRMTIVPENDHRFDEVG